MLKDIRNTKAILGNMSFNIRRNITKARDKYHIILKKGISIEEFLLIQALFNKLNFPLVIVKKGV